MGIQARCLQAVTVDIAAGISARRNPQAVRKRLGFAGTPPGFVERRASSYNLS